MPAPASTALKALLRYWLPRSLWKSVRWALACGRACKACYGATPLRVWKVRPGIYAVTLTCKLQRSHTFEGVEGARRHHSSHGPGQGFNGATPLRVWKGRSAV